MARKRKQNGDPQEPFLLMRQTEKNAVWLLRERGDINTQADCLYRALASRSDPDGKCWPVSRATLMIDINAKSPETVRTGLRELKAARLEGVALLNTTNGPFLPWRAIAHIVHLAWEARDAARRQGDGVEDVQVEQDIEEALAKARVIAQEVAERRQKIAELHIRREREKAKVKRGRKRKAAELSN